MTLSADDARVLAEMALSDPHGAGRDRLVEALLPELTAYAQRCLAYDPRLCSRASDEDLVHEFLYQKVLPAGKLVRILQPVVEGSKELLPLLKRSFTNFLNDQRRRQRARPAETTSGEALLQNLPARTESAEERALAAWQEAAAQVSEQLTVLRQEFPARTACSHHGPVLRLSERLQLAQLAAQAGFATDGQTALLVAQLMPWTADEQAEGVPPGDIPLDRAWQALCERTANRVHDANVPLVAELLGISRLRWDQWLCRARKELTRRLGSDRVQQLFPRWPPSTATPGKGGPP